MKEYNDTVDNDKKVRFYGFDVQDKGTNFISIQSFYKKVNSNFFDSESINYQESAIRTIIDKVIEDLEVNKDEYIKKSSLEEYTLIKKLAENKKLSYTIEDNNRDTEMKNNVLWIQNYEKTFYNNEKIMLWGHNLHISKVEYGNSFFMGKLLSEELKDKYYSLGFAFYSGKFNVNTKYNIYNEYEVLPGREEGLEGNIHSLFPNENTIYFNVASAIEDQKLKELFSTEVNMYNIGASTVSSQAILQGAPYNIGKAFDGLVYFKETFPSHYSSEKMKVDKKIVVNTNVIERIVNENGLAITILGFGFIVLEILLCITIGKKMFKDNKHIDNLAVKGKKILGICIIFGIISDIFDLIKIIGYGMLGIGSISIFVIDIIMYIYLFKGKKLARFLYITTNVFIGIGYNMYFVVIGNYDVSLYISIMFSIVMIAILYLKSVKAYFAYCNLKKDTDVALD